MKWALIDADALPKGRVELYTPADDEGNKEQVILREWGQLSIATRSKITHWRKFDSPAWQKLEELKGPETPDLGVSQNFMDLYGEMMDKLTGMAGRK